MAEVWARDRWRTAMRDDPRVKPFERLVASEYAYYAGSGDTAWCSWDELRRRTGIKSRDAVHRAIAGLVDAGWLTPVARPRQHRSAVYRLTCPVDNSSSSPGNGRLETPAVRETDPSANPDVRENVPVVRENVARRPGNRTPEVIREVVVEQPQQQRPNRHPQPTTPEQVVIDELGATHDEARKIVKLYSNRADIHDLAAVLGKIARTSTELRDHLEALRKPARDARNNEFDRYVRERPLCKLHGGYDAVYPDWHEHHPGQPVCLGCRKRVAA